MRRFLPIGLVFLAAAIPGCADPPPRTSAVPAAPPSATPPWFEEVAATRGLDFVHRSGYEGSPLFPEIMGGGAALFDMEGDGDLDVYLVQSGNLRRPGSGEGRNRLFANDGNGNFEDRSDGSGADDPGYGMGVATGDYDNDGDVDLYVTNYGTNRLLRNDGTGVFEDRTVAAGVGDDRWSTGASFLDYDRDGDLDLFVANYVEWSAAIELECFNSSGTNDYCLAASYAARAPDRLYRNRGDGMFEDATAEAGLPAAFGNALGVVVSDFDRDGWPDIFVTGDATMNQLWTNQQDRGFVDDARLRGVALDDHAVAKTGRGVAAEDFDHDGDLDVIVVNGNAQTDSFFRNAGGQFGDDTARVGLTKTGRRFSRFGVGLNDFDNDGLLDLYEANGGVIKSPDRAGAADPYAEPNLLHRGGSDGRFEEILPRGGTVDALMATSRAAAFGDLDGDGGIDAVVVNRDGPVHLLRNVVPDRGNWIRFRVLDESGRDAYGARVTVVVGSRRVHREVRSTYGYLAANDPRVHIGLGEERSVDEVSVLWTDGATERFGPFEAGRDVVLRRGAGGAPETAGDRSEITPGTPG